MIKGGRDTGEGREAQPYRNGRVCYDTEELVAVMGMTKMQ